MRPGIITRRCDILRRRETVRWGELPVSATHYPSGVTSPTKLSTRGRAVRVLAALIGMVALAAGTLYGEDDWFPLAPFRMFSTADDPNLPVNIARVDAVDAVDATGARFSLDEDNAGVRRAEIEGQMAALMADPAKVAAIADAYASRNPGEPALTEVDVIIEHHWLKDGEVTGEVTDEVVATWRRWTPSGG